MSQEEGGGDIFSKFAQLLREELKTDDSLKVFFTDEHDLIFPEKISEFFNQIKIKPYYALLEIKLSKWETEEVWFEYSSKRA